VAFFIESDKPSFGLADDVVKEWKLKLQYTGKFITPFGISDLCGTVAGMFTPKGSMST